MATRTIGIPIKLSPTDTGLSLTAKVYTSEYSLISTVTSSFTERGAGEYIWFWTFDDGAIYVLDFYNGATFLTCCVLDLTTETATVDLEPIQEDLDNMQDQLTDIQGSLSTAVVTIVSPFAANGRDLTLMRGDDYCAETGNLLSWVVEDCPISLDGLDVLFSAKAEQTGDYTLDEVEAAVEASGDDWLVKVELTHDQTTSLNPGIYNYSYDIQARTESGKRITIANGRITVIEDYADRG